MAVEMQEKEDGKILVVRASGKLTREDYEHFVPQVERQVGLHGNVRILFDLHDFHGWTAGALWQDTKFAWKHFRDIERLAIIGEKSWEHGMAVFCRPFTTAQIRYFDRSDADQAEAWIDADLPVTQASRPGAT
jgi:SpoIIAA-like